MNEIIIVTYSYSIQISPSSRCSKHSTPEPCLENSSYQELKDQELELSGESLSMLSAIEVSFLFFLQVVLSCDDCLTTCMWSVS